MSSKDIWQPKQPANDTVAIRFLRMASPCSPGPVLPHVALVSRPCGHDLPHDCCVPLANVRLEGTDPCCASEVDPYVRPLALNRTLVLQQLSQWHD